MTMLEFFMRLGPDLVFSYLLIHERHLNYKAFTNMFIYKSVDLVLE